jgi:hypothetical protein
VIEYSRSGKSVITSATRHFFTVGRIHGSERA